MTSKSTSTIASLAIATALTACGGGGGGGGGNSNGPGTTTPYVVAADVEFPVNANDVVWDEQRQVLYLSLPSSAGPNGNLVVALDPRTNTVVRSEVAGSEPSKLALSDNGQYLYVGINGSGSVQRFKLPDLVPDLNIPLNLDNFSGAQHVVDLQVIPGAPRSIVVAQGYFSPVETTTNTGIYDDGIARPQSLSSLACGCGSLQWGANAGRLYAANNQDTGFDFYDIQVDAQGLHVVNSIRNLLSTFYSQIHYSAVSRLLYTDDGTVFDPVTARKVGVVGARGPTLPDPSRNRLYVATSVGKTAISGFDSTTLQPVDLDRPYGDAGLASRLVRWGSDGLALVARGGSVHLFGGAGSASFNTTVPQGTVSQTLIRGTINRTAWDPVGGRLYASVSGNSSASANSILVINPATGAVIATKPIGNEPNALSVSEDGQFLYVGLDALGAVQRLRLPGLDLDVTLSLGSHPQFGRYVAGDLKARPGVARTVAVSRLSLGTSPQEIGGVRVYDDAVPRPMEAGPTNDLQPGIRYYNALDWDAAGNQLFSNSVFGELYTLDVDVTGVRHQRTLNAIFGFGGRLHVDHANGLIYHDTGRAVNPANGRPVGTYVTGLGAYYLANDSGSNQVLTLTISNGLNGRIDVYDKARFTRQRTYTVPYEMGLPSGLIQAGPQVVAFVTMEGLHVVRLDPP